MQIKITGLSVCNQSAGDPEKSKQYTASLIGSRFMLQKHAHSMPQPHHPANFRGYRMVNKKGDKQYGWVAKSDIETVAQYLGNEKEIEVVGAANQLQGNGYYCLLVKVCAPEKAPYYQDQIPTKNNEEIPTHIAPKQEAKEMKAPSLQDVITSNVNAATNAAKLEVGHVANDQVAKIVARRLPKKYAELLTTPFGHLLLANAVSVAGRAFYPENSTLAKVSFAMVTSSYQELIKLIDVPGILDELLSNKAIASALEKEKKDE